MTNSEFIDKELAKVPRLTDWNKKLVKRCTLRFIDYYEIYPERALALTMLKFNKRNTNVQYFSREHINQLYY